MSVPDVSISLEREKVRVSAKNPHLWQHSAIIATVSHIHRLKNKGEKIGRIVQNYTSPDLQLFTEFESTATPPPHSCSKPSSSLILRNNAIEI